MILNYFDEIKLEYKKYTFILSFKRKTNLKMLIKSIINQDAGFKDNIRLILVDDSCDDVSREIVLGYEKQFPDNILFLTNNDLKVFESYNFALKHSNCKYINFTDVFDEFDIHLLSKIDASDEDIICICSDCEDSLIDLNNTPDLYLKDMNNLFFKKDLIKDMEFDLNLKTPELAFLTKAQLKTKSYQLIKDASYFSKKSENHKYDYLAQMDCFLKNIIDYCINSYGHIDEFVKIIVLNHLIELIKNTDIHNALKSNEMNDFFTSMDYLLSFFNAPEITDYIKNPSDAGFLIAVKNKSLSLNRNNLAIDGVKLKSNEYVIDDLSKKKLNIDFAMLRDDKLLISGYLKSNFSNDDLSISAIKEDNKSNVEIIPSTSFNYPTRSSDRMMGIEWESVFNFDIEIPLSAKELSNIGLSLKYKKSDIDIEISFEEFSNISHLSDYYVKDGRIILFNDNLFHVMPYSYLKMVIYEIPGLIKVFKMRHAFYKQALFFRLIHLILYPFMRNKRIWIIMDRKNVADDNGEHFFKYAIKQDDGVKKFFTVLQHSPDFTRLNEKYDNILAYESVKHRFYYIFAEKLISSQGSEFYLNPFMSREFHQTAGISNLDFYFLQHGIVLHDLSYWLVKYERNPKLMVTSSEIEYQSLRSNLYNYSDETFEILGLPRYDNLNNSGYKKQIVIMPSWRNYIKNKDDLLASEYFNRFNSLLNNDELISFARKNNYEILFKPHHELSGYLDCFDKNDYVKFDKDIKYQDIFNQSAILITDYSSIFFDFAYLKKPIVYYHYGNDFHYSSKDSYFDYESMGFGKVIQNEEDLVKKIREYISNGAQMEDIYTKRVDNFFKFNDKNNSKRCYDAIYND